MNLPQYIRRWFSFQTLVVLVCLAILLLGSAVGYWCFTTVPPEQFDQFVLYSIDGRGESKPAPGVELFRGYPVLGKLEIQDLATQKRIMDALNDGMATSDGAVASCFWPRHAIHLVHKGRSTDYMICFQCLHLVIYRGERTSTEAITDAPQTMFNEYLTKAGIELAPN
jgi:hypothetical protein